MGVGNKAERRAVEMRRYTRFSSLLAEQCTQGEILVTIVCDSQCHWARDSTDDIVLENTSSSLFWDCQAPFLSLTNLHPDYAARELCQGASDRLKTLGQRCSSPPELRLPR